MKKGNLMAQKINSGIKKKGEMEEIAEFSQEVEEVLEGVCKDESAVNCFNSWMPEPSDGEDDLKERTAEEASIPKTGIEERSDGFDEDLKEAEENLEKYIGDCPDSETENDGKQKETEITDVLKKLFLPITSKSLEMLRKIEKSVYSNFMLEFNPYYFNAKRFSIALKKDGDEFEMKIHTPKKEYRKALKQRFELED